MKNKSKGFTLIELLIVVAIIGILATFVVMSYRETRTKGYIARAQTDLKSIRSALTMLENDTDQWPGHWKPGKVDTGAGGHEIWDLNTQQAGISRTDGNFPKWHGPYVQNGLPPDPWGNPYFFDPDYNINPDGAPQWVAVIGSFGPNEEGQNVFDDDNLIEMVGFEK
jgi:general secretion pathway protein G